MNLTPSIFRKSVFWFALIPVFAVWGFWATYVMRPAETLSWLDHFHGACMASWCLLLILQAGLIRSGHRGLHRVTGKLSYVLVPLIVVSTILVAHHYINQRGLTAEGKYILALQIPILSLFVLSYAMAMIRRSKPDVHARFMICTAFTLIDPILVRILFVYAFQADMVTGVYHYITFGVTDAGLLLLAVLDWKGGRKDVFLPMFFVFLAAHVLLLSGHDSAAWESFAAWFMSLPLG